MYLTQYIQNTIISMWKSISKIINEVLCFLFGFSKSSVYFTMTVHLNSDQPSFMCSVASVVATVLDRSGVDSELRFSPSHPFSSQQATDCLSV